MVNSAQGLSLSVAVFSFDADAGTAPTRAVHVLTVRRRLPGGELAATERFADGALRLVAGAGLDPAGGRRALGQRLRLVGLDDPPGRNRTVTAWYYLTAPFGGVRPPGAWSPVTRGLRLDGNDSGVVRAAFERLREDTRHLAAAASLLGEVFTGDDLLRLHASLHGGPQGSERTFRRRVQELRDCGVLRPASDAEVPGLRDRVARFRSPAGTGGRPPELLRYSGSGGEHEQLSALRARRSA